MDGAAVAAAKSCDVDISCDTIETASQTVGDYRTYIAGRKKWSIGVNYLVTTSFTGLALKVGTTVTITVGVTRNGHITGDRLTGSAIVTDCRVTGNIGHLAQGSFKFLGTGALGVQTVGLDSNEPYDLQDSDSANLQAVSL